MGTLAFLLTHRKAPPLLRWLGERHTETLQLRHAGHSMNCSAFLLDGRNTELGHQPHARPSGLRPQFHPPSKARCSEPGPDDAFRPAAGRRPASICSPRVEVSTHKAAAGRRVLSRQIRSRGNQKAEPWLWRQRGVFVPDALTRHPRRNRGSMHHSRPASIGRHSWYVAHVKGGRQTNGPDAHARTVGHLQHRLTQTARTFSPASA